MAVNTIPAIKAKSAKKKTKLTFAVFLTIMTIRNIKTKSVNAAATSKGIYANALSINLFLLP